MPGPAVQQVTLVRFLVLTALSAWCQAPLISPSRWYAVLAPLKTSSTLRWTRASLRVKLLVGASCCLSKSVPPSVPPSFSLIPFLSFSPLLTASFLVLSFSSLFYPTPFPFLSPSIPSPLFPLSPQPFFSSLPSFFFFLFFLFLCLIISHLHLFFFYLYNDL